MTVDFADERDLALSDGKGQATVGIHVELEGEAVREMAEVWPSPIAKDSGQPRSVSGRVEASAGLLEVVIEKEAVTRAAQRPQIGAGVKKDAFLPESVETFHGGVSAGLSRRDEDKVDAQQEMEPDDLGKAVAIPASSRGGHLVIHLGDSGQSHKSPGINEMATERESLLIGELAGRGGLTDDIDRLERIEANDSPRASQKAGTDQVGLLEIAHLMGSDIGIGWSVGTTFGLGPFCLAGSGQDLLDGRDRRKLTDASALKLEVDRLGSDTGKSGSAGFVDSQFVAKSQDLADERLSRPIAHMFRSAALITKSRQAVFPISSKPFGKPEATPLDFPENITKADSGFAKLNSLESDLIFVPCAHRLCLLPIGLGGSLSDDQITYRCPYGSLHIDVLTETP